jgi:hypothetical protein
MPYYPKSQIKTNLYTNGNSPLYKDSQATQLYTGPYYETSSGQKFTGKFPGDGFNQRLFPPPTPPLPGVFPVDFEIEITPKPLIQISQGDTVPLTDNDDFSDSLVSTNRIYSSLRGLTNNSQTRFLPRFYTPMLTQQEKDQGYLTRYFCKKGNEYKYIEISKEDFNKLQSRSNDIAWDLYTPLSIKWLIKGNKEEVFKSNKGTVAFEEENKKWYGFSQYLKNNFTKYYLES